MSDQLITSYPTPTRNELELVSALHEMMDQLMVGEHAEPGNPTNDGCALCDLLRRDGALIERFTGRRP